ncbi:MAG: RNA polymerase sigma factor SigJ [Actinomycetota bacterium]|nr:RNA polymerase sigma factor SigJ [Actinomycetota bacterium]
MTPRHADIAEELAQHRQFLQRVAYRMVGSRDEAEDIVQEAFLRAARAGGEAIREPRAWLTRIVSRICLDHLKSARARRETYIGPWLPEPIIGSLQAIDPADAAALGEQVGLAFMSVLETLSPAERVVYVLHEAFDVPFSEIAEITGRSPEACRQMAVRARRHIQERAPRFDPDPIERRRALEAFKAACETGDLEALARLLDEHVVVQVDGGGRVKAPTRAIVGRLNALRFLASVLASVPDLGFELVDVNGEPGLIALAEPDPVVAGLVVLNGRITQVDVVANPGKLRQARAWLRTRPSMTPAFQPNEKIDGTCKDSAG